MDVSHDDGEVAVISEKLEKSLSMDTDDKMENYHRLIQHGKDVARQGDIDKALEFFKLALNLHKNEKLERRIKKLEELLVQSDPAGEDDEFVNVSNCGLMLFKEMHDKLYDYQKEGVAFMYSLYKDGRKGGILADDMGLGKTIQVVCFLSGMYDSELTKHTLMVMPTSLLTNWTKEFSKWTPGLRVKEFHGTSKADRTKNLEKVQRRGGVVITTYTMLMNNWQQLSSYHGKEFTWDYMILDEAHKIKSNTTKTAKSACAIPSKNRILLTGTPVQNNLREMWALFDFACQGTLLGTSKTFKAEYENPITRAREKDSTPGEKALGSRMSENLMAIIQPHFLRRTKSDVQKKNMAQNGTHPRKVEHLDNQDSQVVDHLNDRGSVMPTLTRKNDLIVWTYLSPVQEDIYRQFISLDHIKELLLTTRSPLAELNILKKLCDHPRLLSAGAIAQLGLDGNATDSQQSDDSVADSHNIANIPDDTLISESGKLVFLLALLERLKQEGHRTLVFAHFRKVLDIIERILGKRGFKVLRLDGSITQIAERERLISLFQSDSRYTVFLLTTQVGGVGITLTAANRVVIYDPSWNPATDAQAVDRAYRIGQTENVVIYRLITCGTVEEKIYRRQVFKESLIRQNTGDKKNPFRYFSKQELKELFSLEDTRSSSTQLQLQALHSRNRRTDPELDEHIAHLHAMEMFGISDHDLMFSLDLNQDEVIENQQEHHYIEGRVQKAQELMKAESELQTQVIEGLASNTEPAWLRQPIDNNREQSHEKKTTNPRPSPVNPQQNGSMNRSLVVVDLNKSCSGSEEGQQNLSTRVIDLTSDESVTEEQQAINKDQDSLSEPNPDFLKYQPVKTDQSYMEDGDTPPWRVIEDSLVMMDSIDAGAADVVNDSVQEPMDHSAISGAVPHLADESKLEDKTCDNKHLQNLTCMLQASNSSFHADASSRVSAGLESLEGNFNLQLDDSGDMFSDVDDRDPQETEAAQTKLLSQLQMEGSFDVNKSLSEGQHKEALMQSINYCHSAKIEESMNDSIVTIKKKKAAVIYDSEDEDEQEDEDNGKQLENSFHVLGASTPKSTPVFTPLRSRKSVGGNTSVSSRRSLVQSIIEEIDNYNLNMAEEDEGVDEEDYSSERHSDEADEEDLLESSCEPEEPSGETLNTEEEEEEQEEEQDLSDSEQVISKSREETSSNLEESTSEHELGSTEMMEKYTVEVETYDSLVSKGKECITQGKKDDALSFFLKAIDIKPGDPEIQLLTIQLYRQLY